MMTISSPLCGLGAALALIVGLAPSGLGDCEPTWLPGTGPVGIVGEAYATTNWDPDGPGPQPPLLIVGGDISEAGGLPVSNIAAWNGVAWGALGAGLPAEVRALSAYHGELITAAGDEGLFAWNGQYWRPIG